MITECGLPKKSTWLLLSVRYSFLLIITQTNTHKFIEFSLWVFPDDKRMIDWKKRREEEEQEQERDEATKIDRNRKRRWRKWWAHCSLRFFARMTRREEDRLGLMNESQWWFTIFLDDHYVMMRRPDGKKMNFHVDLLELPKRQQSRMKRIRANALVFDGYLASWSSVRGDITCFDSFRRQAGRRNISHN